MPRQSLHHHGGDTWVCDVRGPGAVHTHCFTSAPNRLGCTQQRHDWQRRTGSALLLVEAPNSQTGAGQEEAPEGHRSPQGNPVVGFPLCDMAMSRESAVPPLGDKTRLPEHLIREHQVLDTLSGDTGETAFSVWPRPTSWPRRASLSRFGLQWVRGPRGKSPPQLAQAGPEEPESSIGRVFP